jgi:hypothetical protein
MTSSEARICQHQCQPSSSVRFSLHSVCNLPSRKKLHIIYGPLTYLGPVLHEIHHDMFNVSLCSPSPFLFALTIAPGRMRMLAKPCLLQFQLGALNLLISHKF